MHSLNWGKKNIEMKVTNEFLIPFLGLKLGKHQFDYQINKSFFERFEYDEFESANLKATVSLDKKSTFLELNFKHKGTINVPCDLTNENFDLPIKGKLKIIVRFGETFNNENEELLILPIGEHQIDISQYLYEMIVLSIPLKKIHPGIKDGSLQTDIVSKLKNIYIQESKEVKKEDIDPRWEKLKSLLTDK